MKDTLAPLLPYIRLGDIEPQYIAEVIEPMDVYDSKTIMAVYRYKLTGMKDQNLLTGPIDIFAARTMGGMGIMTFVHQSDFDTNGIIYYLGRLRPNSLNKQSEYQNPHLTGMVQVLVSSIKQGGKIEEFIGRNKTNTMTKNEQNSVRCIVLCLQVL